MNIKNAAPDFCLMPHKLCEAQIRRGYLHAGCFVFYHICHAPLVMGMLLVAFGKAVIAPQYRCSKPAHIAELRLKSVDGREQVSLFPCMGHRARSRQRIRSGIPVFPLLRSSFTTSRIAVFARFRRSHAGFRTVTPYIQLSSFNTTLQLFPCCNKLT